MESKRHMLKTQLLIILAVSVSIMAVLGILYYAIAADVLQKKEQVYVDNLIEQVSEKIVDTATDVQHYTDIVVGNLYTNLMLQENNTERRFQYNQILSDLITNLSKNEDISCINILDNQANITGFNRKNFTVIEQLEKRYSIFRKDSFPCGFTGLLHNQGDGKDYIAYMKTIFNNGFGAKINDKIGVCITLVPVLRLSKAIDSISMTPHSIFMMLDGEGNIIVSNSQHSLDKDRINIIEEVMKRTDKEISPIKISGKYFLVQHKEIPETGWKVVSLVPIREINQDLNIILIYGIIFILLGAILLIILVGQMIQGISKPISDIANFINEGPYANLHSRLEIKEKNEIGQLAFHINNMLNEIDKMTKDNILTQSNMYEMELAKKRAELSALQSQINPHFLYNTLDCIKGYGYLLNSDEIVQITTSLSSIMRYCIKGADMVTLSKEIDCIEKYLKIISIRFENRFSFQIKVPPDMMQCEMPRFILQPIVENAIYHGLEPKLKGGILRILGSWEQGHAVFTIQDNGVGMKPETLAELRQMLEKSNPENALHTYTDRSIGLMNINNRIKFRYGENYTLEIKSAENEGTQVIVRLPYKVSKQ